MNNEYQSGLYGTNLKYFKNMIDFDNYVEDSDKNKEIPNVAFIEKPDEEDPNKVVLSSTINNPVWAILKTAGLIENGKTTLTIAECAQFKNEDLYSGAWGYDVGPEEVEHQGACQQDTEGERVNIGSVFTYYNTFGDIPVYEASIRDSDPWTFNEFKYFTGITELGLNFFLNCGGLTEISIPSSVTNIDENAFGNCIKLEKCTIYNSSDNVQIYITDDPLSIQSAEALGIDPIFARDSAFSYAGSYGSNTIIRYIESTDDYLIVYNWDPATEPSVITAQSNPDVYNILTACNYKHTGLNNGYSVSDLAAITNITVNHYDNESLQDNNMSIFSFYGNEDGNYNSSTYDTLDTRPYQGDEANYVYSWSFNEFKYFTGLTELPDNCFNNCTTLTEITLPDTITHIGFKAFHDCWKISKFNTQRRINEIDWDNGALLYMSSQSMSPQSGFSWWEEHVDTDTDIVDISIGGQISHLIEQGIEIS